MTREDVIRMAREADDWTEKHLQCTGEYHPDYHDVRDERFAAMVAAAEREACAKGCDDAALGFGEETEWAQGYAQGIRDVADGIRARGEIHPDGYATATSGV